MADTKLSALTAGGVDYLYGISGLTPKKAASTRIFNALDYGAVGDGDIAKATANTTAIQAMMDAAGGSGAGSLVFFPAGDYVINAPIYVQYGTNLTICGAGRSNTQLRATIEGFVITGVGQVGPGGNVNPLAITAVADNGLAAHEIRLTLSGVASPTPGPEAYALAPNVPVYTISGATGTGALPAAINGSSKKFRRIDDTHVDIIGSSFTTGTYTASSASISGGTTQASLTIRDIQLKNGLQSNHSGALYMGYIENQFNLSNCHLEGFIGADLGSSALLGGSFGMSVEDCTIRNGAVVMGMADQTDTGYSGGTSVGYAGMPTNSVGLYLGQGRVSNTRATTYETGFKLSGVGVASYNCASERCNTGMVIGQRADGLNATNGINVQSFQTEAVVTGILTLGGGAAFIGGCIFTGSSGTRTFANIANASWLAGTVTITTANNHNLPVGTTNLALYFDPSNAAYTPGGQYAVTCTRASANTFTYALAANPVVAWTPHTAAQGFNNTSNPSQDRWTYASSAAMYISTLTESVFSAITTGGWFGKYSIYLDDSGTQRDITFISTSTPFGCRQSTAGASRAAVKFINCGNEPATLSNGPISNMRFQDLPGQSGVQMLPSEGMEYQISDSNTAAWGVNVTGSGASGTVTVRYNGTNWKVISL